MDFYRHYYTKTVEAIKNIAKSNPACAISVKRIRQYYNESSKDRSSINFYWRCLAQLEEEGILERLEYNSKTINYKVKTLDVPSLKI